MNNRINRRLQQLRDTRRKALVTYLVAGDPDVESSLDAMHAMVEAGVDLIELGVPFSDPAAEGPTIQRAHERALEKSVGLETVFNLLERFRETDHETPVLLMGYANPIEWTGVERFAERAAAAGADGILTVDLPPEEAMEYQQSFAKYNLSSIFLIAPTTQEKRVAEIAGAASGFIYYVSLKGVTGSDRLNASDLAQRVGLVRRYTDLPVCVGFGIKTPQDARLVAEVADGVVIGSSIVDGLVRWSPEQRHQELVNYLGSIRRAID